jgi:hypothetical protein
VSDAGAHPSRYRPASNPQSSFAPTRSQRGARTYIDLTRDEQPPQQLPREACIVAQHDQRRSHEVFVSEPESHQAIRNPHIASAPAQLHGVRQTRNGNAYIDLTRDGQNSHGQHQQLSGSQFVARHPNQSATNVLCTGGVHQAQVQPIARHPSQTATNMLYSGDTHSTHASRHKAANFHRPPQVYIPPPQVYNPRVHSMIQHKDPRNLQLPNLRHENTISVPSHNPVRSPEASAMMQPKDAREVSAMTQPQCPPVPMLGKPPPSLLRSRTEYVGSQSNHRPKNGTSVSLLPRNSGAPSGAKTTKSVALHGESDVAQHKHVHKITAMNHMNPKEPILNGEGLPNPALSKVVRQDVCKAEADNGAETAAQHPRALESPVADADCSSSSEHDILVSAMMSGDNPMLDFSMRLYFSQLVQEANAMTERQMAEWERETALKERKDKE